MLMVQILCQRQVPVGPVLTEVTEGIWNYLGGGERQGYQIPREELRAVEKSRLRLW